MKIVVLDGYTLNPGDLSWAGLQQLGECVIYDRISAEQIIERAEKADCLLINKVVINAEVIASLPQLKYIGVLATGYNVVDVEAAKKRGIAVSNIPVYGTASVAQMVFAHLLNLTQHTAQHAQDVADGQWEKCPDFCFWDFPLIELQGLTMGIVGYGRIGQETAKIARAFGMKVLSYDKFPADDPDVSFVELTELFAGSDVVSLHCPLTSETRGLVNASMLKKMRSGAFIINTSRGPLIDETALAEALNNEWIAGAGLDVLSVEPATADNPLLKAKNCFVTPHIAWATYSARKRLLETAVDNLSSFINGKPQNIVNK